MATKKKIEIKISEETNLPELFIDGEKIMSSEIEKDEQGNIIRASFEIDEEYYSTPEMAEVCITSSMTASSCASQCSCSQEEIE